MNAQEIKKLYKKTKAAYEKRTGEKLVWVMNAKQQRIGTATICTACTLDGEDMVRTRQKAIDEFPARREKEVADIKRRAASGDSFWKERSTPEYLESYYAERMQAMKKDLAEAEKLRDDQKEQHGGFSGHVTYEAMRAQKNDFRAGDPELPPERRRTRPR